MSYANLPEPIRTITIHHHDEFPASEVRKPPATPGDTPT